MNKTTWGIIIIVVVVLAGGAVLLTRHNSKTDNMAGMNMSSSSSSSSTNSTPVATNSVTIQNFAFSPANITIKKGTTVTWTNQDSTTHTVTETDSQTGPNSSDLATGKSYTFTFDTAGTFHYNCSIHPEMVGTVTVN